MAGETRQFKRVKLQECATFQEGYVNPSQGVAEYFGNDVKWLRAVDLNDSFVRETSRRLSKHGYESAGKASLLFEPDTLAISKSGTIGRLGILKDYMCGNRAVINIRTDRTKFDTRFIFYSLLIRRREIESRAVGSVQSNLYCSALGDIEIEAPPLPVQKAIAAVLGVLDDKIELNRRMNATLEAMARALFQSWFVDFDPIRAKLDGRQPDGLDEATAALFPASFQDSEAGHIPKGWMVGKVSDLATLNRGGVNPGEFPTETFDHFSLPAFDAGRTPKAALGSAIMSNKLVVTPNSVLLSKLNPHIPRIWLPDLHSTRRSICSTEFIVACSKPGVSREYLFSLFTSSAFASTYGTLVTGTTGSHQRIRPESVLDMKIVIPLPPLIQAFTVNAKPMFDRINRNSEQSRVLATLRDALLPKLLSGELSVGEIEPRVELQP